MTESHMKLVIAVFVSIHRFPVRLSFRNTAYELEREECQKLFKATMLGS